LNALANLPGRFFCFKNKKKFGYAKGLQNKIWQISFFTKSYLVSVILSICLQYFVGYNNGMNSGVYIRLFNSGPVAALTTRMFLGQPLKLRPAKFAGLLYFAQTKKAPRATNPWTL
jgi:hypothetical protein